VSKIYQKNEQGDIFWDSYLHPECTAVCYKMKVAESKVAESHDKYGNTLLSLVRLIVKLHDQGDMPSSVFERLRDCINDGIIK